MPIRSSSFQLSIVPLVISLLHCQAHVNAPYPKNQNTIESGSFLGPFTGQIQDSNGKALGDVWISAEWKFAPKTSETPSKSDSYRLLLQTGVNGKYQIPKYLPPAEKKINQFVLKAYKFGYEGYRSDVLFEEPLRRHDFSQRDNLIILSPLPKDASHKSHLIFLGCDESLKHCEDPLPKIAEQELALASREEEQPKNSIVGAQVENQPHPTEVPLEPNPKEPSKPEEPPPFINSERILGAALKEELGAKLSEMRNLAEMFEIESFSDDIYQFPLGTTYSGIHFKAKANKQKSSDETKDVALRIWYPKEFHRATTMFRDLAKKLNIKTLKHMRNFRSVQYGQIYDRNLKVHGAILFSEIAQSALTEPHEIDVVIQLSCGKAICKTPKLMENLLFAIESQIDSLTPHSGNEGHE